MSSKPGGDSGAADPYAHLPDNVRKLLRETGTKVVNKDDLEALSRVSVRDLAKYYNTISEGQNAHQAIKELIKRKREQVRKTAPDAAPAMDMPAKPEESDIHAETKLEQQESSKQQEYSQAEVEIPLQPTESSRHQGEIEAEVPTCEQQSTADAKPEGEQQDEEGDPGPYVQEPVAQETSESEQPIEPDLGADMEQLQQPGEEMESQPQSEEQHQQTDEEDEHERTDSLDNSIVSDKECPTPPLAHGDISAQLASRVDVGLLVEAAEESCDESEIPAQTPPAMSTDPDIADPSRAECANDNASNDGNEEGQNACSSTVPAHTIDISLLPAPKWLRSRFDVIKYDPKAKLFSKKIRTWEIDFLGGAFRNMDRKGKVKKEFAPNKLLQIERHASDNYKLRMLFFGANHSYELEFTSITDRERFYECACALRPKLFVWCPDIVLPGAECSKTQICGSVTALISEGKGKKPVEQVFSGSTTINATVKPGENISIFCCTWNMDSKPPPEDNRSFCTVLEPGRHDIYALAVQESTYSQDPDEWFRYAHAMLGEKYVILASQSLWDIRLVVLTRKRHLIKIVNVQGEAKPTSFTSICGNKGGLGIGLRFIETSILFVACHLASSQERTAVRNTNILEIVDSLRIGNKELDILSQFHHVFWMGDLNYRVDLPFAEGLQFAETPDTAELLKHDQLKCQIECGNILKDMSEGDITFKPTFKYLPGSLEYDTKKARTPSYTDRILFKSFPGMNMQLSAYNRIEDIRSSNHLPVFASFVVECHRPFVSIFSAQHEPCHIVFSNLYVTDRPSSDVINKPVLVFYAHFLQDAKDGRPKTDKLTKTANPRWKDNQVPVLVPVTSDSEYLRTQHVVVALRDGPEKAESTEGLLGQAIIPLHNALCSMPAKFSETLYLHGVKACILNGSVHVKHQSPR